jgi:type IV secretory pathway protease TraF
MSDASFRDGAETPLHLKALDADDLPVISTLIQDAVLPVTEIRWDRTARRLALLVNRFRWEDRVAAEARGRGYERVQSLLVVEDVMGVATQAVDRTDRDLVLSILSVTWEAGDDGTGRVVLTLAGDGAIAAQAECLDVTLRDVTRPYLAPSGKAPDHG